MKQTYLPAHRFSSTNWAKGTTTELVKYPPESDFLKRDFIFRISTATGEAEESTFSDFSGLTRILMILEGSMTLIHEGRYQKHLVPYDQDTFDGSWSTRSIGKVRDFNVMFNEQAKGELRAFQLKSEQTEILEISQKRIILFVHTGLFSIGEQFLETGSVLDIEESKSTFLLLKCIESGTILCS
ncbi:MAG: HutD family protein, partial [Crocinitomicaceae bacterium]|nr:HutD family protein [Crocinitomicaceae bacterium]